MRILLFPGGMPEMAFTMSAKEPSISDGGHVGMIFAGFGGRPRMQVDEAACWEWVPPKWVSIAGISFPKQNTVST